MYVQDDGNAQPNLLPKKGSAKAKTKAHAAAKPSKKVDRAATSMQEDGDDILQDYELSDEDSDAD